MNKFNYLLNLLVAVVCLSLVVCLSSCRTDPPESDEVVKVPEESLDGITFKNNTNTVFSRLGAEPDRFNPLLTTSAYSRQIYEQLYLPLVDTDYQTLEPIPALAKGRPVIEEITEGPHAGGLRYTYELYDNITWSDGVPLTARDLEFAFKMVFNYNIAEVAAHRVFFNSMVDFSVDSTNDRRISITTSDKYILGEAAFNSMIPLPTHSLDPGGLLTGYSLNDLLTNGEELSEEEPMKQFASQVTSAEFSREGDKLLASGPYVIGKWDEGQLITMGRNDNWWVDDLPGGHPSLQAKPDSLVFRIIPDQTTAITALKDELIDVVESVDSKDFVDLRDNDFAKAHFNMHTPDMFAFYYLALNNKDIRLNDKRVRRAITHLVDIEVLIEQGFYGLATPLNGPVMPTKSYYAKDLPIIPFEIEKASSLLTEAGWTDTNGNGTVDKIIDGELVEMELEYLVTPGSRFGNILSSVLKDNAEQVGINITITPREFGTMMTQDVGPRTYQMYGAGAAGQPIPDDFTQLWHTSSNTPRGTNRVQFGNAETDALIDAIRVEIDEEKRNKLYREFQEIVYEEQPMVFLFVPQNRILISKRFRAKPSSIRPGFRLRDFELRQ